MPTHRRPPPPLDAASLERLALRYVERFATTRARLVVYLTRKIRERGWDGAPADPTAIAERFATLGYIDDRSFAESKAASMARRGLGARRVNEALRYAGIERDDAEAVAPQIVARRADAALAFARRRRIGPFAVTEVDRDKLTKQAAAMMRAGHSPDLVWQIVRMVPGECVQSLLDQDE
jgi:regulatory protein